MFNNNNIKVSFPKQMDHKPYHVKILIDVLEKYKTLNKSQKSVVKSNVNTNIAKIGDIGIGVLFKIIDDYLENGYFKSNKKIYSQSVGRKIDFTKTIKKIVPYYVDSSFVYPNYIKVSNNTDEYDLLRLIHKYVVYKVSKILEFYYGDLAVDEIEEFNINLDYCIDYLNMELSNSTNDYKTELIINLLGYFQAAKSDGTMELFIETSNFDKIWEDMLRRVFCNVKHTDYYFNTEWVLYENGKRSNKSSQLDLIFIEEKLNEILVYVIDAKYYSYNSNNPHGTLPQTTDINKQIGYLYYVRQKINEKFPSINDKKYYNLFMLPFSSEKQIELFGYATSQIDKSEIVYGLNVDILILMKQYLRPANTKKLVNKLKQELKNLS